MPREKETRIVLPKQMQTVLREVVKKYKGNGSITERTVELLNNFYRDELKDIDPELFAIFEDQGEIIPASVSKIERAFSKTKQGKGCKLELAKLICTFLHGERITLKEFAKLHRMSPDHFTLVHQDEVVENAGIDIFEEAEMSELQREELLVAQKEKEGIDEENQKRELSRKQETDTFIASLKHIYTHDTLFSKIRIPGNESMEELSMSEYYIQLSSMNAKSVLSPEELLVLEKQSAEYKSVNGQRGIDLRSAEATRTISADLWEKDNYAYVIGNPGVGKSTYARWLCHLWAKDEIAKKSVLVYINLRNVNFISQNSLIEYIAKVYFKQGVPTQNLPEILAHLGTNTVFFLDGLDEINFGNKLKLYDDLIALSESRELPRYVMFTRPYGLLESKFRLGNVNVEIIGFNNVQRFQYLTALFARNKNLKSPDRLLKIIDNNVVLKSLSFNPLMLSYLALIYFHLKDETDFAAINSTYSITEKLVEIIIEHHQLEKNMPQSMYVAKLQQCLEFCGNMEINKQFVYATTGPTDKNLDFVTMLSQLGLGHLSEGNLGRKIFHVHTVTVQEYLASTYWGKYISQEAFLYLIGDPVFWNLSKMILGHLSHTGNEALVKNILLAIHENCNRNNRLEASIRYFMRLRTNILGELSSKTLNDFLTEAEVYDILVQYWEVCYDPIWCPLYEETITRIYHKVDTKIQKHFIEYIINEIEDLVDFKKKSPNYSPPNQRVLVEILGIKENYQLANYIIEKLAELRTYRLADPAERETPIQGSFYRFWSNYLLEILNTQNIKTLPSLTAKCNDLLADLKQVDAQVIAIMLSLQRYGEAKELVLDLRRKLIHDIDNGTHAANELFDMAREYCLMLSLLDTDLPQKLDVLDDLFYEIAKMVNTSLSGIFGAQDMKELNMIILPKVVVTAVKDTLKNVFDTQAQYGFSMLYTKYQVDELDGYINWQIAELEENFVDANMRALMYAFKSSLHAKYALSEYMYRLAGMVLKFYDNASDENGMQAKAVALIDETFQFPFDRKVLVDFILTKEEPFSFLPLLNALMSKSLPLNEQIYWDFIIRLSYTQSNVNIVFTILNNRDIYHYPQSLDKLQLWWREVGLLLKSDSNREIWLSKIPQLLEIAYHSIVLLQETYRAKQNSLLLEYIREVITDGGVREATKNIKKDTVQVANLIVYPLMYGYYSDTALILGDEYEEHINVHFYQKVIKRKVPLDDCKRALGNEIFKKLEAKMAENSACKYEVDKNAFTKMLINYSKI